MSSLSDTSPEVERVLFSLARQAPPWRKVEMMGEMYRTVRELALSGLRERYPNDTAGQLQRRLAGLLLGNELSARVYGPIPEEQPQDAH